MNDTASWYFGGMNAVYPTGAFCYNTMCPVEDQSKVIHGGFV